MPSPILISICIPAYKRTEFLKRLLDSITGQIFRDFEVIVTDDSPDMTVKALCETYKGQLQLRYFRNAQALGSPENWNEAIRRSEGQWIKIMHDDDWFVNDEYSLGHFAAAIDRPTLEGEWRNACHVLFFQPISNVFLGRRPLPGGVQPIAACPVQGLSKKQYCPFASNIVGPPSVVLYKKEKDILFAPPGEWVVDIEFYIRYLRGRRPVYIDKVLVNVGYG